MKNLHQIQPELPDWVKELCELWWGLGHQGFYPLRFDSKLKRLEYKYGNYYTWSGANQYAPNELEVRKWSINNASGLRIPFRPDMIEVI